MESANSLFSTYLMFFCYKIWKLPIKIVFLWQIY